MGWRFRKSFKLLPGVRINLSKSGISTTLGVSPFSINLGARGTHANFNLPGTGISFRQRVGYPTRQQTSPSLAPTPTPFEQSNSPTVPQIEAVPDPVSDEIRSASTLELSSKGLEEFRKVLLTAIKERDALDAEIASAKREAEFKAGEYQTWANGFLMKRIRRGTFRAREQDAKDAQDKLDELMEQRALTVVATKIDVGAEELPFYGRLCDAFAALCESERIWDTISTRQVDRAAERSVANDMIERTAVAFKLSESDLLKCEWHVPYLENANGGDLFLYPGFVLYRVSPKAFAVIDSREVTMDFTTTGFLEEETVPADAKVIGQTWKYTNKSGTRDMRFNNNYQVPIVRYGEITLMSPTGLRERYMISNPEATERFANAWSQFQKAISDVRIENSGPAPLPKEKPQ